MLFPLNFLNHAFNFSEHTHIDTKSYFFESALRSVLHKSLEVKSQTVFMSATPSSYKVVFVGDTRVGKTSLINYYIKRDAGTTPSTLGATSTKVETTWEDQQITMSVWDTAGQETFRNLVQVYARGASSAVIVFNQHSQRSWTSVQNWYDYLSRVEKQPNCKTILVANKSDKEARVDMNEVYQWAESKHIEVIRTSAVTGTGVDMIFSTIAKEITARHAESPSDPPESEPQIRDVTQPHTTRRRCGC